MKNLKLIILRNFYILYFLRETFSQEIDCMPFGVNVELGEAYSFN